MVKHLKKLTGWLLNTLFDYSDLTEFEKESNEAYLPLLYLDEKECAITA